MKTSVVKINRTGRRKLRDRVVEELTLTIRLERRKIAVLACSPGDLKELSLGFLYSSGIVSSLREVESIEIDSLRKTARVKLKGKKSFRANLPRALSFRGSSGGMFPDAFRDRSPGKKINNSLKISAAKITELMKDFEKRAVIFQKTGGTHSAAACDPGRTYLFAEDIGRHNALDKVIGKALLKRIDMSRCAVLTSGRVSSEIISKARRMGSPILVSPGAPTAQAVKLARRWNLTLVGFARGERMNVYAGEKRITLL